MEEKSKESRKSLGVNHGRIALPLYSGTTFLGDEVSVSAGGAFAEPMVHGSGV